ncbi:MAG: nucleotide sugar dehydrogenase [Pseudomonadota bacterium]
MLPGEAFDAAVAARSLRVGVIGLGYVGLPLVKALTDQGFPVTGFDVDPEKVTTLNGGRSYIQGVPDEAIASARKADLFEATADFEMISQIDAILICVPTPLSRYREPDLSFIVNTTRTLSPHLSPGTLVVLESTTYPGTTSEVVRPILESGDRRSADELERRSGEDFFLAYSPEREDPGNIDHTTSSMPKVVGGDGAEALRRACLLYDQFVTRTVPVSSPETAEAVKLTENIFRSVNIALVNELKGVFSAMDIDVWEVIDAAKTKPFGFMPFYPGPGLGGHCIPIDPFYLTWKAREFDIATRFIELAGEINTAMPRLIVEATAKSLDARASKGLNGAKILIAGVAYKKNVQDVRESPALNIMDLLIQRGAEIIYHDPLVPVIPTTREHPDLAEMKSQPISESLLAAQDAVVIITDHDDVDYDTLASHARLIIDTRNAMARVDHDQDKVVRA